MFAMYTLTRVLPIKMDATGKRLPGYYNALLRIVTRRPRARLPGGMVADTTQPSERILACFFYNVVRRYRASPFYRYMSSSIAPADVFVDVGAHLGLYSYLARGLGAETILIEPDPAHGAFLDRNRSLLGDVFRCAAAERSGTAAFFRGRADNTGGGSLVASRTVGEASGYESVVTVPTARIDALIMPERWPRVVLIKIDVEGGEVAALRGIGEALVKYSFDIWCEVRSDASDRNPGSYREICSVAAAAGFTPYIFDGARMEPFHSGHVRRVFDLLLVKSDSIGLRDGNL